MKHRVLCAVWFILMVSVATAGEVGYVEDFALARDRAASLRQLIPGTEDYYYYHCLHFLNTEQFEKAEELTHESERHMKEHVTYSRAVTMSQIAIAVAAVSVLSKRPMFWYLSMGFGAAGVFFLTRGLLG